MQAYLLPEFKINLFISYHLIVFIVLYESWIPIMDFDFPAYYIFILCPLPDMRLYWFKTLSTSPSFIHIICISTMKGIVRKIHITMYNFIKFPDQGEKHQCKL